MHKKFLVFFFLLFCQTVFSQNIDSLLKVYKHTTNKIQKYDITTTLTYFYMNQQNWDSTDLFLKKTIRLATTFKDTNFKAESYLLSGNVMNEKGMYLKADSLFDKGLQCVVRDDTKASLYISKFYLCIDLGNLENSLFYLQNARNHLKDTASALMPKYYLAYFTYYYHQGDLLNELRMLQKAQEFFQNANTTNSINNKLATIYYNLHAYEEALDLSIKSRKIAQQNKNYIGELYALFSIMSNYLRLDDYEASKRTCFEAIQLKNTKKVSKVFGYVYYTLGKVYLHEQQYDSSQYYFNKGIEISKLQHEDKELADNHEGIAELYFEQKRFKEAKLHIEKAYAITTPTFLGNNAMLPKIYAEEKNYQKAYELLNQSWTVLEKKTRNRRDFKIISDLLNEKFEQEKKYKAEQLKAKNWLVYFISILAVIFGILSILLLSVNRQRRQLSRTLKKKNKELEAIDKAKT
ncbi:MAG: tetratricopeptide repeat protein, partial [Saprospiraceae bacterium]